MATLSTKDFVVCGNGAIGMVAALHVANTFPSLRVALVGEQARPWSASLAAGAMIAVLGEVEDGMSDISGFHGEALALGLRSSALWRELLARLDLKRAITARSTIVYLPTNAGTFEQRNFAAVESAAQSRGRARGLSDSEVSDLFSRGDRDIQLAVEILDEFAIDPAVVLSALEGRMSALGVEIIDDSVRSISDGSVATVSLESGDALTAGRVLLAAGVNSGRLIQGNEMQPMLQGVGTALLANTPAKDLLPGLHSRVIRSVNRGGAQCGIHLLPRCDGQTYIGAGNYVSEPGEPETRFETVRYLLDVVEKELIGREATYSAKGRLLLGNRPRSLDGLPLVGTLDAMPNIFVATATNRLGLTWAPAIAEWVAEWIANDDVAGIPEAWHPSRQPVPFGPRERCHTYFVESRLGNAIEHGLVELGTPRADDLCAELGETSRRLEESLRQKFSDLGDDLPTPDVWTWLLSLDGDEPRSIARLNSRGH